MKGFIINLKKIILGSLAIATVILIWWGISKNVSPIVLPSPIETIEALQKLAESGKLWKEIAITAERVCIGFTISLVLGTFLGCMIGSFPMLFHFFKPIIVIIQTTPPISWIILAIIWFDFGGAAPIFVVVIATFPIFVINAIQGTRQIPSSLVEMAKIFHASFLQIAKDIYFPALWPFVSSAISICIGISWKTIVMAELLSSSSGAGAALSWARLQLETAQVLAWTLVIVILGVTIEQVFQRISDMTRAGRIQEWK
ncbi:hypothetical protein BHU72_13755 [Desulfuribacillus stibiiarsenatis]|uniref:ABC transmembrane type-1 domain-containing protein n=1 Tax=Desulfuribacillus stibiiarsenatis TaxID=1390249 RepID=A0A1E5L828_9FIRM|nr:ABC transporter permease [Desulfuribacillus stibiiarsenatis]OEH86286.1 hypothetical protein BHU72_13755 [Desulfuribacillus stibiiarsenatis]